MSGSSSPRRGIVARVRRGGQEYRGRLADRSPSADLRIPPDTLYSMGVLVCWVSWPAQGREGAAVRIALPGSARGNR